MEYAEKISNVRMRAHFDSLEAKTYLENVLQSALKHTEYDNGEIRIEQQGSQSIDSVREVIISAGLPKTSHGTVMEVPITYQNKVVGQLSSTVPDDASSTYSLTKLSDVARQLAFSIARVEVNHLAQYSLGKPVALVGDSEEIRAVEEFIEHAAFVDFPVIINGEFGTEKLQVACAIHFASSAQNAPFIEVNCATQLEYNFEENLPKWFAQAKGGTLFFNGIDQLSLAQQSLLPSYLRSSIGQWLDNETDDVNVRIIASSTNDLEQKSQAGEFLRPLFAELNFLAVTLPTLKKRRSDIPTLIDHLMSKYNTETAVNISDEAMQAFMAYDWPENRFELERVLARLMAFGRGDSIDIVTLERFVPEVVASLALRKQKEEQPESLGDTIALNLLDRDFSRISVLHGGLQKALLYLADNYTTDISLSELSANAFVSSSHLSYLFKYQLNRTFKQVLSQMRVERAKVSLQRPETVRVTDVSLEVGFGDLSHFEKIFKRYVGVSPREYRRNYLEAHTETA